MASAFDLRVTEWRHHLESASPVPFGETSHHLASALLERTRVARDARPDDLARTTPT